MVAVYQYSYSIARKVSRHRTAYVFFYFFKTKQFQNEEYKKTTSPKSNDLALMHRLCICVPLLRGCGYDGAASPVCTLALMLRSAWLL